MTGALVMAGAIMTALAIAGFGTIGVLRLIAWVHER